MLIVLKLRNPPLVFKKEELFWMTLSELSVSYIFAGKNKDGNQ